ncbi:GNAT family N-acetyltransferase [Mycoplasma sp. CSL7503-lung]|uniref:GNAT family N-acetyltransferase n=1 Tax=Mycoplasma sp. CSL7503-lung TaxID=536372 RepID=UPI0021D14280|nr:GNAT family N-acetyltransferase [Mycoplasma sp. CSL7503-lung]MCU4706715.1 GNAT family N-acetyltransferase [Mycoplasma sp. CSL7503-lung]
MIQFKKAVEKDKEVILKLLYNDDPIQYLFLISDIEEFGLHSDVTETYFATNYKIIIMRFYNNLLIYTKKDFKFDTSLLVKFIKDKKIKNIIYSSSIRNDLEIAMTKHFNSFKVKEEYILKLNKEKFYDLNNLEDLSSKIIEEKDLENIINSRKRIKEFEGLSAQALDINYLKTSLNKGYYKGFIKYDNNIVISHASVSAQIKNVAMLGGVFTLEEYRKKGHAKDCVLKLSDYLLKNNYTPVLFFDNPHAGNLYYKLGFEDYSRLYVISIYDY